MELLIQSFVPPKGVKWCNKKFKSENYFSIATYGIKDNDAYIRLSQTGRTVGPHRHVYFRIPNFMDVTINDLFLFVYNNCDSSDCYPLGRNFEDAVMELHGFGMRFNRWR